MRPYEIFSGDFKADLVFSHCPSEPQQLSFSQIVLNPAALERASALAFGGQGLTNINGGVFGDPLGPDVLVVVQPVDCGLGPLFVVIVLPGEPKTDEGMSDCLR